MKKINEAVFTFPSKSVNEGFARAAVAAFAAFCDPTAEELADIRTAVSEAVTNAVVHAYPDTEGPVRLAVRAYDTGALTVTVRDRGVGIADVAQARQALYTTAGEDRSGLGFTVMESFSDKLSVRSKPGAGTAVTITKYIKGKAAR